MLIQSFKIGILDKMASLEELKARKVPFEYKGYLYTYSTYRNDWVSCRKCELPVLGIGGKDNNSGVCTTSSVMPLRVPKLARKC